MGAVKFDWFEYIVFAVMLLLSTTIGVFFCCSKGGQHTVSEYYLGNKELSVFPVAMSLVSSFISGVTLLGLPSEIYTHGAQIGLANVGEVIIFLINVIMYQPVFYNLQLISLYEYLEMRFDHRVRVLASAIFTIAWILYMPIVIYSAALAFNYVSEVNLHIISPLICLVCIFYTTVGGLKAVVWADALQGSMMLLAIIIVVITGVNKVGGVRAVFTAASQGGRLEFFNMDPDPTQRLSFWSASIGMLFLWISEITSPTVTQRYLALPSLKHARKAVFFLLLGVCSFYLLSAFMGLVIYTNYSTCDPLTANKIKRPDQILPYFVLDVAGHIPGLPGLFVAGIVCAALSSLSTGMNTLSGTIYEDFIEPTIGKQTERTASNIMKLISLIIGIISTGLVYFVERLGNIVDMIAAVGGVTSGAIFGMFTMGVLIPRANAKGAFFGGITSSVVMIWTMVGHELAATCDEKKPVSVEECFNFTSTEPVIETSCEEMSLGFKVAFPLYKLTAFYYGLLGCTCCLIVGMIVSYFTGFNDPDKVNQELLSPIIRISQPKETKYTEVPLKTIEKMSDTL